MSVLDTPLGFEYASAGGYNINGKTQTEVSPRQQVRMVLFQWFFLFEI